MSDPAQIINILFSSPQSLIKIGYLVFSVFYFIFSLIIVRQVYLMTEVVATEGGSLIRALSILHSGLALGIIVLFVGFL